MAEAIYATLNMEGAVESFCLVEVGMSLIPVIVARFLTWMPLLVGWLP